MTATLLAGSLGLLLAAPGASEPEPIRKATLIVVGTVTEPRPIAGTSWPEGRPAVVVSLDPLFLAVLKVERTVSGQAPWRDGSEVALLLHSPTQTFLEERPGGKRYRLTFEVTTGGRQGPQYRIREARTEPDPTPP